jgi:agmatinase
VTFPGATADRSDARYYLRGAPLDATTSFRPGARFGPDRVRRFATPFDDYDRRTDAAFTDLGVHDAGDLRAWPDVPDYLAFLRGECRDAVADGAVPLLVGGEHTVTAAGVAAVDPDVAVVVDAHLDLRDAYDGDPWSHACVLRRLLDGGPGPTPDPDANANADSVSGAGSGADREAWPPSVDRAIVVGARTGSRAEYDRADESDVTVVPPADVPGWDAAGALAPDERAYLSVDVDAVDPGFAPATGTMEPFGLAPRTVLEVVRAVAPAAAGFDVVEVNDRDEGQTAALAAKLLRAFVYEHAATTDGPT